MQPGAIYLNFHGIGSPGLHVPPTEFPYWLSTDQFQTIVDLVGRSTKPVRLTFDDGNASDLEWAVPILRRAALRAAFFIVTDRIGVGGYLSAPDIATLKQEGMAIGSHGTAHVAWTNLSSEALFNQVSASLFCLSDILAAPVREVAVPFGAYNRSVLGTLRSCSVSRVYTSDGGPPASESSMSSALPAASIGVDFGTSNTVVALATGDGRVEAIRFEHGGTAQSVYASALCFWQERPGSGLPPSAEGGPWAIERLLEGRDALRFMQSFKTFAASRTFQSTTIFRQRYQFEDLLVAFLRTLTRHAGAGLDLAAARVTIGRPVRFAGARSGRRARDAALP